MLSYEAYISRMMRFAPHHPLTKLKCLLCIAGLRFLMLRNKKANLAYMVL